MRLVYPRADTLVAVSDGAAKDLGETLGLCRGHVKTIYNPVVFPGLIQMSYEEVPDLQDIQSPIILAAGRLAREKDYPTLLKAFSRVLSHGPAKLIILGTGELEAELKAQAVQLGIADHLIMPGFVDNPYAWMRRANVFVLSSAWEGFGNVLVEAMACGTPVVSTDCPSGPAEILEGGKWGRLVPVGDHEALSEAILDELRNPSSSLAVERAESFATRHAIDEYEALILGAH